MPFDEIVNEPLILAFRGIDIEFDDLTHRAFERFAHQKLRDLSSGLRILDLPIADLEPLDECVSQLLDLQKLLFALAQLKIHSEYAERHGDPLLLEGFRKSRRQIGTLLEIRIRTIHGLPRNYGRNEEWNGTKDSFDSQGSFSFHPQLATVLIRRIRPVHGSESFRRIRTGSVWTGGIQRFCQIRQSGIFPIENVLHDAIIETLPLESDLDFAS